MPGKICDACHEKKQVFSAGLFTKLGLGSNLSLCYACAKAADVKRQMFHKRVFDDLEEAEERSTKRSKSAKNDKSEPEPVLMPIDSDIDDDEDEQKEEEDEPRSEKAPEKKADDTFEPSPQQIYAIWQLRDRDWKNLPSTQKIAAVKEALPDEDAPTLVGISKWLCKQDDIRRLKATWSKMPVDAIETLRDYTATRLEGLNSILAEKKSKKN